MKCRKVGLSLHSHSVSLTRTLTRLGDFIPYPPAVHPLPSRAARLSAYPTQQHAGPHPPISVLEGDPAQHAVSFHVQYSANDEGGAEDYQAAHPLRQCCADIRGAQDHLSMTPALHSLRLQRGRRVGDVSP